MTDTEILTRLERLEKKIDAIIRNEKKSSSAPIWVPEEEAAKTFRWTAPYLRKQVKNGEIPIRYKETRGRNFRYRQEDITDFLNH